MLPPGKKQNHLTIAEFIAIKGHRVTYFIKWGDPQTLQHYFVHIQPDIMELLYWWRRRLPAGHSPGAIYILCRILLGEREQQLRRIRTIATDIRYEEEKKSPTGRMGAQTVSEEQQPAELWAAVVAVGYTLLFVQSPLDRGVIVYIFSTWV